jgi:AraC-like DNA-binding protein
MSELIKNVDKLSKSEGINKTELSGVYTYRASEDGERNPLIYNQGIIFIVQGSKKVYKENQVFDYNPDNFLVLTVPLPLECEAKTEKGKPLLGITIDIETNILNSIINQMGNEVDLKNFNACQKNCGLFTSKLDQNISDILLRLTRALQSPTDSKIIGKSIITELIYTIMKRENAAPLYSLAMKNTALSKVELALQEIHNNYDKQIDVNSLASIVNMSISSFHHTFKNVTSSSPIQYIKKIRLNKAKNFLIEENLQVNEVARVVGYESVSQFNREFKRYFGETPGSFAR